MSELGRIEKASLIVEAALERKAEKPVALDVREVSSVADTFIMLSGGSDRQVRAIADFIAGALRSSGDDPIGIEGMDEGRWVLMDCNDVIVHVFAPGVREYYDLERLWSDAPAMDLEGTTARPSLQERAK